jgi:Penicillin binding protein transpeptidase domain
VFRSTWSLSAPLTITLLLLAGGAAIVARFSPWLAARTEHAGSPTAAALSKERQAEDKTNAEASPCANSLSQFAVCVAANQHALEIMNASHLEAFTIVQDVRTGALVAFAASRPSSLDVTTPVLPLSVSKLLLAASWWDNAQPDSSFDSYRGTEDKRSPATRRVSVHEMLVGGSDKAALEMAIVLRRAVGTDTVLKDLKRYGFGRRSEALRDDRFWAELAPVWATRLVPSHAHSSLTRATKDSEWARTLSIGETNLMGTGLHISRFLQAVGNGGIMLSPAAREELPSDRRQEQSGAADGRSISLRNFVGSPIRVMQDSTSVRLQAAMRDTVQRGSAKSIANSLTGTGWSIGGKTGTSGPAPIGPQSDGWFAGLIFDEHRKARFTVATFVRRGGLGGGNAARISAELARFIIGNNAQSRILHPVPRPAGSSGQ